MTAPCAGFVWFRWARPRTWHAYEPQSLVFHPNNSTALQLPRRLLDSGQAHGIIREFLGHYSGEVIMCRATLSQCVCGANGPVK